MFQMTDTVVTVVWQGRRIRRREAMIVGRAPLVDPVAVRMKGFTLSLRNKEADSIDVEAL